MHVPVLTDQQRAEAVAKATASREARKALLADLRGGALGLEAVLARADAGDAVILRTPVIRVLRSLPGYGKVRTERLMDLAGISRSRRVAGLGRRQRAVLLAAVCRSEGAEPGRREGA